MSTLLVGNRTTRGALLPPDVESVISSLAQWSARDINDLSVPELDDMIAAASRGVSWMQGMRVRATAQRAKLVDAAKPKPKPGSPEPKPEKPLPAAGGSRKEQQRDEDAARGAGWAPSFGIALEAGEISMDHVAALGRVRNHRHVPRFETALLCQARIHTAEDFTRYLHTWDAERDREEGVDRTASQRARRRVSFNRDADGLGTLYAALAPLDATRVENTIRQIANELFHASGDDGTTMAQRLADALVLMADRATGTAESSKSSRPTLVVICDEDSLRGRVEDAGLGYTLDGRPVPASELRRIACDANILPAVMNGAGQIIDWGRERRTANDIQRLALLTMYGGCIIDGCPCPTQLLEIHHLPAWDHGGRTDLHAMAPLCKGDHTRSHAERWTYARGPDGAITITTRNGTDVPTRRPRRPASRRAARAPASTDDASPDHASAGSFFDLN